MDGEFTVTDISKDEDIVTRHRREKKDLQGKIQQLKKGINKDKKKKKEVTDEITRLEKEQQERHERELCEVESPKGMESAVTNGVAAVSLSENPEQDSLEDNNAVEPEDASGTGQGRKVSKAAKRRQKKADANRAREAMIREEKENNRFCARNVEAAKLKKLLQTRKLKMSEIKPDGDCMYAAMAHQMDEGTTVAWLRTQASQYMKLHPDDFAPFITDPKTGEMLTPEEFIEYCNQTENTPAWGGQPELRALSQVMKKRIEVLQAEGSPIIFGEDCGDEKPVILTYYRHYYGLGEHYNSVAVLVSDDEEDEEQET